MLRNHSFRAWGGRRLAIATPAAASAMPSQASGGMASPIRSQAMTAAVGGTRKNSAETREAPPRRIMASSSVTATRELPNQKQRHQHRQDHPVTQRQVSDRLRKGQPGLQSGSTARPQQDEHRRGYQRPERRAAFPAGCGIADLQHEWKCLISSELKKMWLCPKKETAASCLSS